ncbi:MAG TPA: thioredoxin [Gammaproteobacteria bacterium]|nr:thioredoxin [Gammaproteobacteria bacterium]
MTLVFRKILPLLLIWAVAGTVFAAMPRDPAKYFYEQTLGDLTEDLADARKNGKTGVLLFFQQEECPFCHRMKITIMNQVKVQEYFQKRFLILEMDTESDGEIIDFDGNTTTMKKYFARISNNKWATPLFAFFNLKGKLVVRYTGATSGIDEFIWLAEYTSEEIYRKMTFSKYKRIKRKEQRKRKNR